MKKKIMIGAFAALFLSVGIFAATTIQDRKQVSGLTLANIEAMSYEIEVGDLNGNCSEPWDNICVVALGWPAPGVLTVNNF